MTFHPSGYGPPDARADARFPRTPQTRHPRGQALVELALILPILMLCARWPRSISDASSIREITVANAATEGAIEASLDPTSFTANAACNAATNRVMCRAVNGDAVNVRDRRTREMSPSTATGGLRRRHRLQGDGHRHRPRSPTRHALLAMFTGGQNITFSSSATAQITTAPVLANGSRTPTPTPRTPTPDRPRRRRRLAAPRHARRDPDADRGPDPVLHRAGRQLHVDEPGRTRVIGRSTSTSTPTWRRPAVRQRLVVEFR